MHPLDILENLLASRGVAGVRRAFHVEAMRASLAATLEFSAIRWWWWRAHGDDLLTALPRDHQVAPELAHKIALLPEPNKAARLVRVDGPVGQGEIQEVPASISGWNPGQPFMMFQERFQTALIRRGIPATFAPILSGALHEMASNARDHSDSPMPPVASYELGPDYWSFSVTDVGCGILGSLRRNPNYASLTDEVHALRLALSDGISASGTRGRGYGFTFLFKHMVNRMCSIRFRSIGATVNWAGTSPALHKLQLMPQPTRAGFHVCVSGELTSS